MMPRTVRTQPKPAYSSMPLIIDRGKSYLTKDAKNDQFRENYGKRIEDLNNQKLDTVQKIEDLEMEIKRLDGEEQIANLLEADNKKLKKLIPIYRDKRSAKENIKKLKEKLADLDIKIDKVSAMDRNILIKENIFTAINIDIDKVRHRKTSNTILNKYNDKKIDLNKLKHVKRGLYLDILETANFNKLSFKKYEKKYDVDHIVEKERQYKQENEVRMETAAIKHKTRLDKLEKKHMNLKTMRNTGEYNPERGSLYPEELLDVDYSDYMQHRGVSASSAGRNNPLSSKLI